MGGHITVEKDASFVSRAMRHDSEGTTAFIFAWHPTPHVGGIRMLDGRTDSALILEDLVNVFRTG